MTLWKVYKPLKFEKDRVHKQNANWVLFMTEVATFILCRLVQIFNNIETIQVTDLTIEMLNECYENVLLLLVRIVKVCPAFKP